MAAGQENRVSQRARKKRALTFAQLERKVKSVLPAAFRLVGVVIALAIHAYEVVGHDDTCGHCYDILLRWRRER